MTQLDLTTSIAVWGALAGTLAIIWDIIKWTRSGARLYVEASGNNLVTGLKKLNEGSFSSIDPNRTFTLISVTNRGDKPTSIMYIGGRFYRPATFGWRKNYDFVINPITGKHLPCLIEPGEVWHGLLLEDAEGEDSSPTITRLFIKHSQSSKLVASKYVKIHQRPPPTQYSLPM